MYVEIVVTIKVKKLSLKKHNITIIQIMLGGLIFLPFLILKFKQDMRIKFSCTGGFLVE